MRYDARELTSNTRNYPLTILIDTGDPVPDGHGVRIGYDGPEGCGDCRQPAIAVLEATASGGGNPAYEVPMCGQCLVGYEHLGLVPTRLVAFQ